MKIIKLVKIVIVNLYLLYCSGFIFKVENYSLRKGAEDDMNDEDKADMELDNEHEEYKEKKEILKSRKKKNKPWITSMYSVHRGWLKKEDHPFSKLNEAISLK